ncbi:MAG: DUF2723 domain-containing protein [Anaerolineales bacterium]|uniref:DUF2723 domain-containing protein n=1 Tax=Candidatus Desulfolinea nitratireducens TaxID=2841698 RepID=A0A8J6TIY5_9CHLR|nr:DUF2723 domain-containing protein [Candidatus Desulfolinea nitratireducens]MBL6961507.1 DUF2723 domain-containing protein [Anaerolineales bacterium]
METKSSVFQRLDFFFAILVGIWSFALYFRTLAPSVLTSDSAEFQTLFYTLGMTHPTGYPVHVLIGKLFTLIPIQTIAYRANLASAFFAAVAVAEIYLIVYLLGRWRVGALVGALALAHMPLFWRFAIIAESYSISSVFSLSILLFILLWREQGNWRSLLFAGILGGLSIGVHGATAMAAPAIAIYLLLTARKRNAWISAIGGAAMGIFLLIAAFIYIDHRDPPSSIYNAVYRPSLSKWGLTEDQFVTPLEHLDILFPAESALNYFFDVPASTITNRFTIYQSSYSSFSKLLILIGFIYIFFRNNDIKRKLWFEAILVAGIFLPLWLFALTQNSSLYAQFFTLSDPILYIWLGLGICGLLELLSWLINYVFSAKKKDYRNLAMILLSFLIIIFPFWQSRKAIFSAWENGYTRDIKNSGVYPIFAPEQKARLARRIVNKVEEDAIVFTEWDRLYTFYYVAHIERGLTRIDFHQAYIGDGTTEVADSLAAYIAGNIDTRPIYTTIPLLDLIPFYTFEPVSDDLLRLHKRE